MTNPLRELKAFIHAALIRPVPRDHAQSDTAFLRRRIVAAFTLLIGAGILGWALRVEPGDASFYYATVALAAVWTLGAVASGPLHLGWAHTRDGDGPARPLVQPLAVGALLLGTFLAGAVVVANIPFLRDPVNELLEYSRAGSFGLVFAITAINGAAEELYFRGALYAGVGRRHAVAITTALYAAVTAASGILLLVFAAAVVGLVVGLQRRVTGGILAPIVTHLTWSLGMLVLLPVMLAAFGPS